MIFFKCNPLSSSPKDNEVRTQIRSKYGVAAKDLNLKNQLMRNMGAKLIWQNYRQALDKENIVSRIRTSYAKFS